MRVSTVDRSVDVGCPVHRMEPRQFRKRAHSGDAISDAIGVVVLDGSDGCGLRIACCSRCIGQRPARCAKSAHGLALALGCALVADSFRPVLTLTPVRTAFEHRQGCSKQTALQESARGNTIPRMNAPTPEEFTRRRLRRLFEPGWEVAELVDFHTRHKLELFSHDLTGYRDLGRLVGSAGSIDRHELERRYRQLFIATIAVEPTRARHVDTMTHAVGHLRGRVECPVRQQVRDMIEAYRQQAVDLEQVRSTLYRCAREHAVSYLVIQTYLSPETR